MIIQNQTQLNALCLELSRASYIAVDTEFLRDKTFYPKLCLIQLAAPGGEAVAIDPVDFDLDLTPLFDLMKNDKVLKVFHAARQDLEIFYFLMKDVPAPLFDTQVAAMVLGYGDQIGYNALVQEITGTSLSKSAQFTDWARRPLSQKQITYALDDVIYLRQIYEDLNAQLIHKNRVNWVFEEMDILKNPATYDTPIETVWERVKIRSDKPEVLSVLREMATWREREARARDIPRGRLLKDETLADLAMYMPRDLEGLLQVRTLPADVAKGKLGSVILELIQKGRKIPRDQMPHVARPAMFPKQAVPTLEMLKMLLRICASEADVAPKILASAEDLETLAIEDTPNIPALQGWRYDVFGKEALRLKQGEVFLGLERGRIVRRSSESND